MLKVKVEDAVGMILCHDITQIIPGELKGRAFKKGHIVTAEDIPRLLLTGKENLYVWEKQEGTLHEDEAARRIATAIAGAGISLMEPAEGKINLVSSLRGLLKINVRGIHKINTENKVIVSSLHRNQIVENGTVVAGTRIIPLVIDEKIIERVEEHADRYKPVVEVKPLLGMRVGIVVTGSEIYKGRIEDKFSPVVEEKVTRLGCSVIRKMNVMDDVVMISYAVKTMLREGAESILITGGMSVDPDDMTPAGARDAAIIALMYGVGLRREEVTTLALDDYDPGSGKLVIRGKRSKERTGYLVGGAVDALADWLVHRGENAGPLFLAINKGGKIQYGRRVTPQAIYNLLARRAESAGVKHFSPHDLRRTFVSDLLESGADIAIVAKMAGHADVSTTSRYDRRPEQAKHKAALLLHISYKSRMK